MSVSNLSMVRGDTPSFDLDINEPSGSPYNLAGMEVTMRAARHGDDPGYRAVFTKSTTDGSIVVTDAANGKARVDMRKADTSALDAPVELAYYVHAKGVGTEVTPIMGTLTIEARPGR